MLQTEKAKLQEPFQRTNKQLERLLDLHLEGVISTQEYSHKKEVLLKRKISLEEQLTKIEKGGNIWLEPLQDFFKAAHQAHQLAETKNLAAKTNFARRLGSNFRLSDRTLSFSYAFPWPLLKKPRPISILWASRDSNPQPTGYEPVALPLS